MLSEGEEAGFTLVFQTAPRLLPTLNLPWPPETPQPGDGVPAQGRPKLSMLWSLSLAVKFLRLADCSDYRMATTRHSVAYY